MEILIKILQLILSLSILVIFHEFGHFAFAKIFKTRVEKFYLFFNPWFSLFKFKKGETEYGIGWLPLGGYVKISGMIDESMDKEQMKLPPQPFEFRSKSAGQRLLIMIGGVLVNFLLALVIYIGITFAWGDEYLPVENMKHGIMVDSLGLEIGLQNGDKIIALDDNPVSRFMEIAPNLLLNEVKIIHVERNGVMVDIPLSEDFTPKLLENQGFILPGMPFVIDEVLPDSSPANLAGLKTGDRILAVNQINTWYFFEVKHALGQYKNQEVPLTILRENDTTIIPITVSAEGKIGVSSNFDLEEYFTLETQTYGLIESIPLGIKKGFKMLGSYVKQFKLILNPKTEAYKSVGSFIRIGSIFPSTWDWQAFWSLTAFLSIALAFLNMLPIPALDGGHVLFLLVEVVTGRKPGDKFMEYAQIVGMILLLGLMLLANYNDIMHFIIK